MDNWRERGQQRDSAIAITLDQAQPHQRFQRRWLKYILGRVATIDRQPLKRAPLFGSEPPP